MCICIYIYYIYIYICVYHNSIGLWYADFPGRWRQTEIRCFIVVPCLMVMIVAHCIDSPWNHTGFPVHDTGDVYHSNFSPPGDVKLEWGIGYFATRGSWN